MENKAEKILMSAIAFLVRHGIKKATMDDIAEYAHVSKVTIYKYFTDKDTLYLAIAKYIFLRYSDQIDDIVAADENLVKKLYDFLDTIGEFSFSGHFRLCDELRAYNLRIEAESRRYMQCYESALSRLIDHGISERLFTDGLSKDLIYHYINMGIAYFQQNDDYRTRITSDALFRQQFMQFHIGHIFNDPGSVPTTV